MKRFGLPVLRPLSIPTPCRFCPKIPADKDKTPEHAVELSDRNWRAYAHHMECRAVNSWPDDPIVRRNARIIRALLDEVDRQPMLLLIASLGKKAVEGG